MSSGKGSGKGYAADDDDDLVFDAAAPSPLPTVGLSPPPSGEPTMAPTDSVL